jgi:hypothetical protein
VDAGPSRGEVGERRLRVAGWSAIAGAVAMGVGLLLPFQWSTRLPGDQDTFALSIMLTAVLGLVAGGCTLLPAVERLAGAGILVGVAAASTRSLVQLLTEQLREADGYETGYWVEVLGHVALVAAGCVAGIALARSGQVRLRGEALSRRLPQLIVALGVAGMVALVVVDQRILAQGVEWFWAVTTIWLTLLALLLPATAAVALPRRFGAWLLVGWVGGAGAVVVDYYLWTAREVGEGDYDIGLGAELFFAVTLIGLLVAAVFHARGEEVPAARTAAPS